MESVLPNLVVEIKRSPDNQVGFAQEISRFIRGILQKLNYHGKWDIFFSKRLNKSESFKFKFIQRWGHSLICIIKPNETNVVCWEVQINPPKNYLLDIVADDLKQIPPNGEVLSRPMRKIQSILPVAAAQVIPVDKESENSCPAIEPVAQQNLPFIPKSKKPPALNPKTKNLCRDGASLSFALQCIGQHVSMDGGYIDTQKAIEVLQNAVEENQFLKRNPYYTDSLKVSVILLKGLCDRGFLARMAPKIKKATRHRAKTKGYLLTPDGRKKLAEDAENKQLVVEEVKKSTNPVPVKDLTNVLPVTSPEVFAELFKNFTIRQKAVSDCDSMIQEQQEMQERLKQQLQTISQEIASLEAIKTEEQKALEQIKMQLKQVIGD